MITSSCEASLPTDYGTFRVRAFRDPEGREHLAVYKGDIKSERVPVRVHSQCTTGDTFHSLRCDCGKQLIKALKYIQSEGNGVVLYMEQEGRGIGLFNKINAYLLQENGSDTVEANEKLGFESDLRTYTVAAEMLKCLRVKSVLLMTNNMQKMKGLEEASIKVEGRIPLITKPNKYNRRYLHDKKVKMDQLL
ncbi:MAG: GTP cyclohydrolase II [Candidatus Altiarchaeota archaeon]